jgi:MFS family permease
VAIGACNLAFTALALGVIDRFGRRTLLLVGAAGLTVALAGVAAVFIMGQHQDWLLWLLVGFIAFFAFSQGAVIWVYISEIFPTDVRARGQSLGASTHWFMDAIIAAAFPWWPSIGGGALRGLCRLHGVAGRGCVLLLPGNQAAVT